MKKLKLEIFEAITHDNFIEKENKVIPIKEREKGITMVSLVVTIIIMIILISITVSLTIGNNGIVTKAKQAKRDIEQASLNEQIAMNELYDEMTIATQDTTSSSDNISTEGIPDKLIEYIDAKLNAKMLEVYPVGSIYISTDSTNPSELFGGTWESYGEGKTIVGTGEGYVVGTIGGSATATLKEENLPSHYHRYTPQGTINSTFIGEEITTSQDGGHYHRTPIGVAKFNLPNTGTANAFVSTYGYNNTNASYTGATGLQTTTEGEHTHTIIPKGNISSSFSGTTSDTESTGSGASFSVQNPYIVTYMWKRVD